MYDSQDQETRTDRLDLSHYEEEFCSEHRRWRIGETQRSMRATNQMGRSEDPRAGDEDDTEEVLGRSHVTEREG